MNLGIHEKGRVTAESVAFARYALYGSVYWHHTYRAVKAMLQRVAWQYLDRVSESDKKSHAGIKKTVRHDLYQVVRRDFTSMDQQLSFEPDIANPSAYVGESTRLHPGDRALLAWLANTAGESGRQLIGMIEERNLFKRLLVISSWGDKPLWTEVANILAGSDWRRKLKFQQNFQRLLVSAIENVERIDAVTTLDLPKASNAFLEMARSNKVLILVDAAKPKPGASLGLEIVREEDRRRALIDEAPTIETEESSLWSSLRSDLHESLGKVRIFCHPDHARFLSTFERHFIENVLKESTNSV